MFAFWRGFGYAWSKKNKNKSSTENNSRLLHTFKLGEEL
jgi:hypothetical protein